MSHNDNILYMLLLLYATNAEWRLSQNAAIDIVFNLQGRERPPGNWSGSATRTRREMRYWENCVMQPDPLPTLTPGQRQVRIQITDAGMRRLLEATDPRSWDLSVFDPMLWLPAWQQQRFRLDGSEDIQPAPLDITTWTPDHIDRPRERGRPR